MDRRTRAEHQQWRRTACGDLTSAFDFDRSYRQPSVDKPGPVPAPIARWKPTPPVDQAVPQQEPGRRPARAIPYQPSVSGLVADGKLMLALGNDGAEAAHFAIYPYGGELPAPAHVDVRWSQVEKIPVDGPFELAVQGPNRFWVELAGSVDGAAAGLDVRADRHGDSLELELVNTSRKPLTVKVKARGYGSKTVDDRAARQADPLAVLADRPRLVRRRGHRRRRHDVPPPPDRPPGNRHAEHHRLTRRRPKM